MTSILLHYHEGGWAMWLILFWLVCTLIVVVERIIYLFSAHQDPRVLTATVTKHILAGDWVRAVKTSKLAYTPLGYIVAEGLRRAPQKGVEGMQEGMDEAALMILPKISKNIQYLALFANLSMLCGLFGTIIGLIKAFGAVGGESVDPSQKARLLADGISEAMNCTAFGLLAAIIALIGYAGLNWWSQVILDDIQRETTVLYNKVVKRLQQ